jgi:hypothetical protein
LGEKEAEKDKVVEIQTALSYGGKTEAEKDEVVRIQTALCFGEKKS